MTIRQRRKKPIDDPDLIFIVRTLPLGVGEVYRFEEAAQADARQRRWNGERAYVVPRKVKE